MNIKDAKQIIAKHFEPIVGQDLAKARLTDIVLGGVLENGYIAPTILLAPKGIGKTMVLKALRRILKEIFGRKGAWFETGKDIGNTPKAFFEGVLIEHFHRQDAILFCDEVHEAAQNMQNVLRSMVEPTVSREPKSSKPRSTRPETPSIR